MTEVRYGLKLAPQYTTIGELRSVWRTADEAGFDHCWTYDHFASIGDSIDGDVYDGWMLLASMAELTSRVRIGCMVTGNTYRHPGVLAKMATTVDHLSGGRLEFGLGAAWAEQEHDMLGLEFGAVRDRMDRFDEACHVIKALWTEPAFTHEGRHYRLADAVSNPKPIQRPHPPIWVGGKGRKRSLRIAAEHADAWNTTYIEPEEFADLSAVLDAHCAVVGRDPANIRRTIQLPIDDDLDEIRRVTDEFVRVGATDVIYVVTGDTAVKRADRLAEAMPILG